MQPTPPEESKMTNCVWAVCFNPGNILFLYWIDGTQVLVAVADRVFIYDALSGEMIKQTKG